MEMHLFHRLTQQQQYYLHCGWSWQQKSYLSDVKLEPNIHSARLHQLAHKLNFSF